MAGNPVAKAQRITALSERYDQIVSDFHELLPPIYRYKGRGTLPTGDARADAWATADHEVIMAMIALHELVYVLREHAKLPPAFQEAEPNPKVNGEVAEQAEAE